MNDDLFGTITFSNGARWNPLASAEDEPSKRAEHAVLDLVVAIRGTRPNKPLGNADEYVWAGEWELAVGEIDALIKHENLNLTELEAEVLRRAKVIVMGDD